MRTKRERSTLIFFFPLLILLLVSCKQQRTHPIEFYHWKTKFQPTAIDSEYFDSLGAEKVYLRFFDVDKEQGKVFPKATIQSFNPSVLSAQYVPVIFITNRTFRNLDKEGITDLAYKIRKLINQIERANNLTSSGEIQIDCDWTENTRYAYFHFLTLLQKETGREITCTLRLHQIKYFKRTGIPPVKKGYLMCYATSDPTDTTTQNSILDLDLLKDYTTNINEYPLAFDIALPLYSWGIVTNHLGNIKLVNGVTEGDMHPDEFIHLADNIYEAKEDVFLRGLYISQGFTVRIEGISSTLLKQAKSYLDKKIKRDYSLLYYHLDESFLQKFTIEELR